MTDQFGAANAKAHRTLHGSVAMNKSRRRNRPAVKVYIGLIITESFWRKPKVSIVTKNKAKARKWFDRHKPNTIKYLVARTVK